MSPSEIGGGTITVANIADDSYNKGSVSAYDAASSFLFIAGGVAALSGVGAVATPVLWFFSGVIQAAKYMDRALSPVPDNLDLNSKHLLPYKNEDRLQKDPKLVEDKKSQKIKYKRGGDGKKREGGY
jgi:hypothetical protein